MKNAQNYTAALDFFGKPHWTSNEYADEIKNIIESSKEEKLNQEQILSDIYQILQLELTKNQYPPVVYTDKMETALLQDIEKIFLEMKTDLQKMNKDLYPLQEQKLQIVQELLAKRSTNQ